MSVRFLVRFPVKWCAVRAPPSNQCGTAYTRHHLSIYSKNTNEQLLSLKYVGEEADLQLEMSVRDNAGRTKFKLQVAEDRDSAIQFGYRTARCLAGSSWSKLLER